MHALTGRLLMGRQRGLVQTWRRHRISTVEAKRCWRLFYIIVPLYRLHAGLQTLIRACDRRPNPVSTITLPNGSLV